MRLVEWLRYEGPTGPVVLAALSRLLADLRGVCVHERNSDSESPTDGKSAKEFHATNVEKTYRNLRMGMVVLVVILFSSILLQARSSDWCFQSSISAYYYTNSHIVFVSVLCALGALLIAYKGNSDTEDSLYDFAGYWAFIVATVPTGWPSNLSADGKGRDRGLCGGNGLPSEYVSEQAVTNNFGAVLVGGVAVTLLAVMSSVLRRRSGRRSTKTVLGWVARGVGTIITVFLVANFIFDTEWFEQNAHNWSAVPLFVFIILAVGVNAGFKFKDERKKKKIDPAQKVRFGLIYLIFALGMAISLVVALYLHRELEWSLSVLVTEVLLLSFFAGFWIAQTIELWGVDGSRRDVVISKF